MVRRNDGVRIDQLNIEHHRPMEGDPHHPLDNGGHGAPEALAVLINETLDSLSRPEVRNP